MKAWLMAALLLSANAIAQTESEREHVAPEAPKTQVHEMPYGEMARMMGMDDRKRFGKIMLDQLEWRDAGESAFGWDAAAWYGGDFNKLWIESEGAHEDATHSRSELLWDRIVSPWWSARAGMRHDAGGGPSRDWAAFGIAGLAPGFIEIEASAYLGESGRTALRLEAGYDLLLTQRFVLHPKAEINVYGSDDAARLIGSGVSDITLGLRVRYEVRREFAPYAGVSWTRRFGASADFSRAAGADDDELAFVAGLRLWF
jgi:copper resistance protein B